MKAMNTLYANDLTAYFKEVSNIPVLTRDEEYELANLIKDEDNIEAAQKLVLSNLRFVIKIAKTYAGYGFPLADLIQEGNVGLMKAIKHFSPKHNVRLVSYAIYWIKSEINEFVIKNYSMVRVATTKEQRKMFFNIRKLKPDVTRWLTDLEIEKIAKQKNVSTAVVRHMEIRMYSYDESYDKPTGDDREEMLLATPEYYLESDVLSPEEHAIVEEDYNNKYKFLQDSMQSLNDNHHNIIQRRWLNEDKTTLQELATERGVSPEAIRQAEEKAINNMTRWATWL